MFESAETVNPSFGAIKNDRAKTTKPKPSTP
jgi:hypothetical protein